MGLPEKRVAAALEKESFPAWKKKVSGACGGAKLEWDVKWTDLVKEGYAEHYPQIIEFNFINPLTAALEKICSDDMGKEAFKGKIKKVKITTERTWMSLQVKVTDDTLHLDADPSYARTERDCKEHVARIQKALEGAL